MSMPLEGTRIIELNRVAPGSYCTMMLGDMGAEVLRVETLPRVDGIKHNAARHDDVWVLSEFTNRNKQTGNCRANQRHWARTQMMCHPPPHQLVVAAHDVAEPVDAVGDRREAFARVELEPQRGMRIVSDVSAPVDERFPLAREQDEIVAIAQVGPAAELVLDELIEPVQANVGEELVVQTADGQAGLGRCAAQVLVRG